MAEEIKEVQEIKETPKPKKKEVNKKKFIARKLKVINNMTNKAKAKALAERVMNNK